MKISYENRPIEEKDISHAIYSDYKTNEGSSGGVYIDDQGMIVAVHLGIRNN